MITFSSLLQPGWGLGRGSQYKIKYLKIYYTTNTLKLNILQWLLCLCSLGGTSAFVLMLLSLRSLEFNVSHQWIMFTKLLPVQLIVVLFCYKSMIIVNHIDIFVFEDYKPLLKSDFLICQ